MDIYALFQFFELEEKYKKIYGLKSKKYRAFLSVWMKLVGVN